MRYLIGFVILLVTVNVLRAQDVLILDSLYQKTLFYKESAQEDSMLFYGQLAEKLAIDQKEFSQLAKINITIGNYYLPFSEKDSITYMYYYKALRAYIESKDSVKTAKTLFRLAILEKNNRNYFLSKASSFEALAYLNGKEAEFLEGLYNHLGIVFNELESLKQSIYYHRKALELRIAAQDTGLQIQSYNNIATAYKFNGQLAQAIAYYQKGLSYPEEVLAKNPFEHARLLDNYAHLRFLMRDTNGVALDFRRAMRLRKRNEDIPGLIMSYIHLAQWERFQQDYRQSNDYAIKAEELAKKTHNYRDLLVSIQLIGQNYESQGKSDLALIYSKKYSSTLAKVQDAELKVEEKFADIRFESTKKENENKALRQKNQNQRLYFYFILGTLAIILLMSLLYVNNLKLKSKEKELEYQQEEQRAGKQIEKLLYERQEFAEQVKSNEQQRIANDLHDSVAGKLSGVVLHLDNLSQKADPAIQPKLDYITDYLSDVISETHAIVQDLNNERIIHINFADVLEEIVVSQLPKTIHSRFEASGVKWEAISNSANMALYYILQQALRNIKEHSHASRVEVTIQQTPANELEVEIKDNGRGFDLQTNYNMGIPGMKRRAEAVGGEFSIASSPHKGTVIDIKFPRS